MVETVKKPSSNRSAQSKQADFSNELQVRLHMSEGPSAQSCCKVSKPRVATDHLQKFPSLGRFNAGSRY
jgi:hypothetical protein